jgi:alkylhydroperoxidase family enzyme
MNQPRPDQRLAPLPLSPELGDLASGFQKSLGFVPNSVLIMQRRPKLARAFTALTAAVWDPEGKVDRGLKRLVAHVASRAHGCHY